MEAIVERMQSTLDQLLAPGKGMLVLDEYGEGALSRRGLAGEELHRVIERLTSSAALMSSVSGVLLTEATFSAVSSADRPSGPERSMLVGVRRPSRLDAPGFAPDFVEFRAHLKPLDVPAGRSHIDASLLAGQTVAAQQRGILPIVTVAVPDLGSHRINVTEAVTGNALRELFSSLERTGADLTKFLLRVSFIDSGQLRQPRVPVDEAAATTVRRLSAVVPAEVPGVMFLSGGMTLTRSCALLGDVSRLAHEQQRPWKVTFAFSRALVESALGRTEPGASPAELEEAFASVANVAAAAMAPALQT